VVAAFGTTKGMITGHLFRPPPLGLPVISVKETYFAGDILENEDR